MKTNLNFYHVMMIYCIC